MTNDITEDLEQSEKNIKDFFQEIQEEAKNKQHSFFNDVIKKRVFEDDEIVNFKELNNE